MSMYVSCLRTKINLQMNTNEIRLGIYKESITKNSLNVTNNCMLRKKLCSSQNAFKLLPS